jgi:creatinine amidohydrolase/Fe(II)-dependent formamide hydrolase-like protein
MRKPSARLRSLFLEELTTTEVEAYFKRGGRTALIPVGSVEMHGPHMPIGTDMMIARAFSLRLAAETDGIVFPDVAYSWAGATEGFAGTVSIPPEKFIELVSLVAVKAWKMGFRRIAVVSVHGPNDEAMFQCVRRVYEVHGVAAHFLNPYRPLSPKAAELFAGEWSEGKEASMLLAALDVLGKPSLYAEKEFAYDDPAPRQLIYSLGLRGVTGFFYQDKRHHVAPTRQTSKARGLEFFDAQVKPLVSSIKALDKYVRLAKRQKNQGWFR